MGSFATLLSYICNSDSRVVCPQYDALDLLNTREHLIFYAKIKGIKGRDIERNVDTIMNKLGLTPHASRAASKLSGGNKRKLSLAIALMGKFCFNT